MGSAELQAFEAYCLQLYTSPHAEERAKAEAALVQLSTTPEYIPRCQIVLSSSTMPYAQLVASNALKRLLQSNWNHLTPQQVRPAAHAPYTARPRTHHARQSHALRSAWSTATLR
jgi:hypothetical protein